MSVTRHEDIHVTLPDNEIEVQENLDMLFAMEEVNGYQCHKYVIHDISLKNNTVL